MAITFFIVSIFLYFKPLYFGSLTKAIAIFIIVIGFAGLGIELENLTNKKRRSAISQKKGTGIFDNLGIGLAMFIIWAALYHYFPTVWVNVLTTPFLLFSVYGMTLGLINILVQATSKSRFTHSSTIVDSKETDLSKTKASKDQPTAMKIAAAISGIVGFIASAIQILQFLKIIK